MMQGASCSSRYYAELIPIPLPMGKFTQNWLLWYVWWVSYLSIVSLITNVTVLH